MDSGRINPKKCDYITDLLHENRKSFALVYALEERAHHYERERQALERSGKGDMCVIAQITGKINGLYYLIRQERRDISKNLKKIEEIRNGSLKEI